MPLGRSKFPLALHPSPETKAMATKTNNTVNSNAIVPDSVNKTLTLYEWVEQERIKSAIPKALWDANIEVLQDDFAFEYLLGDKLASFGGHSAQYATKPVRDLLKRHENLRDGIWAFRGEGVPYCKPINPRPDWRNFKKLVKYETPSSEIASPIMPTPVVGALRVICKTHNLDFEEALEAIWLKDLELATTANQLASTASFITGQSTGSLTSPSLSPSSGDTLRPSSESYQTLDDTSPTHLSNSHLNQEAENQFSQSPAQSLPWQIWKASDATKLPRDAFWAWWADTGLALTITEGLKKALALIAYGIPAIAVRGITQWCLKGSSELHPEIAKFATKGRKIYIVFDQDTKLKTIADVHREARKLGNALEAKGCKVFFPQWPASEGKGVDDCLYAQGDNAQAWLDGVLKNALTLKQYKRNGQIIAALNTIKRYNSLSFPIERDTKGEYMPELPTITPGAIHVVTANINSGKTVRIGADWVQWALANGYHVLGLAPLNSLGQQTAKNWGIEHIHNQGTKSSNQRQFWEAVKERPAVVLCPDSIGKIPQWFWEKPVLLVLDEANQVTKHIAQGDTLKSRYSPVLEAIESAAKHAIASGGAIVLSEDGIPDRCVNFWQAISGATAVRCFRHQKQGVPWEVKLHEGHVSGFRSALLARIRNGEKILFVTSSQREAKRLERIINEECQAVDAANIKVTRIDSETNEGGAYRLFFENPDQWLQLNQPDVLILSPSAKSGVSIEGGLSAEDAYFSQVWGYFPSLDTDTHMQLLGRYRPPVPRNVFVPPLILGDADEGQYSVHAARKRLESNVETVAKLVGLADEGRELSPIESAILDYLAESAVVSGSQKAIAKDALIDRLESAGHTVSLIQAVNDTSISEIWKQAQEDIWQDEALEIANAAIEDCHTPEWAYRTLDSMESTRCDRILAHKVLWRDEFPGVLFDDQAEVYEAITKDYGLMRRGVLLQARAQNLDAVREGDRATAEQILSGKVRAGHRLPKNYIKALMIERLGVLALLDGKSYSNSDKRCISIKQQALRFANEIGYWLRLQIKATQSPVEICNKLLRKLGLKAEAIARPGKRGQQNNRVWAIPELNNPTRKRLLEAACSKLSSPVSTICNNNTDPIQIVDTSPPKPQSVASRGGEIGPNIVGRLAKYGTSLSNWLITAVEGAIATIQNTLNGYTVTAPVEELALLEVAA